MRQESEKEIMNSQAILDKYHGQLLGTRSSNLKSDYYTKDFIDQSQLIDFIVSTHDHEAVFTKKGFEFIEEYYGLDKVIEMIIDQYPDYPFDPGITPLEALANKKEFALDMDEIKALDL